MKNLVDDATENELSNTHSPSCDQLELRHILGWHSDSTRCWGRYLVLRASHRPSFKLEQHSHNRMKKAEGTEEHSLGWHRDSTRCWGRYLVLRASHRPNFKLEQHSANRMRKALELRSTPSAGTETPLIPKGDVCSCTQLPPSLKGTSYRYGPNTEQCDNSTGMMQLIRTAISVLSCETLPCTALCRSQKNATVLHCTAYALSCRVLFCTALFCTVQ